MGNQVAPEAERRPPGENARLIRRESHAKVPSAFTASAGATHRESRAARAAPKSTVRSTVKRGRMARAPRRRTRGMTESEPIHRSERVITATSAQLPPNAVATRCRVALFPRPRSAGRRSRSSMKRDRLLSRPSARELQVEKKNVKRIHRERSDCLIDGFAGFSRDEQPMRVDPAGCWRVSRRGLAAQRMGSDNFAPSTRK